MKSLIIPIYKNDAAIPALLEAITRLNRELGEELEAVFVVDGSPDNSFLLIRDALPGVEFASKLILLSRNFGSFAAIRSGLCDATGPYFAVLSADLQEPEDLIIEFFRVLQFEPFDVVIGRRVTREDPLIDRMASNLFWFFYRRLVMPEIPRGGVDVFACNKKFRDQLIRLEESRTSLIAQIFWLGFRRKLIDYKRVAREAGNSAWTMGKKIDYLMDTTFSFSELPISMLFYSGILGLLISIPLGIITLLARITGWITVPGYATTVLLVLFFGALNMFGLGLVGSYAWRGYENSKGRPDAIVMETLTSHNSKQEDS